MLGITKSGFKTKFLWIYGIAVLGGGTAIIIADFPNSFMQGLFYYGILAFYGFIPCVVLALIIEFLTTD